MSTSWLRRVIDARVQMQKMRETSMGFIDGESGGSRWLLRTWVGFRAYGLVALRLTVAVAVGLTALGALLVAIRLIPLLIHPDVPHRVSWLLVRSALLSAAEMALLAAPAIGWAVAAASLSERGEARALSALGVRPIALLAGSWPGLAMVGWGMFMCAALWGGTAASPGRLGSELLLASRHDCLAAASRGAPAASAVPVLGLTWICMPGGAVRLVGPLPTSNGEIVVSARSLRPSDDLRRLELEDAVILADSGSGQRAVLRVGHARLSGLRAPVRSSPLSRWVRAGILAPSSALLGLMAGWLVLRRALRAASTAPSRTLSAVAAIVATGLSIVAWAWLERTAAPVAAYVAVPAVGVAVLVVLLGYVGLPGAVRGGTSSSVHEPRTSIPREENDECDSVPPRFS